MVIVYTLIAKNKDTLLIEYAEATGNFNKHAKDLLAKIENGPPMCIDCGFSDYNFFYLAYMNFSFMCLTDRCLNKSKSVEYLDKISKEFTNRFTYENVQNSEDCETFKQNLIQETINFNQDLVQSKSKDPNKKADEELQKFVNIKEEKLSKQMNLTIEPHVHVRKTDRLRDMSFGVDNRLFKLKWQIFFKTYIKWPLVVLIIFAVIYAIASFFKCGNLKFNSC